MNNKTVCLLNEVYMREAEVLKENSCVYLNGVFMEGDLKNNNGRVYPGHILEREAQKFQNLIKDNRAVGQLDHPNCNLSNDFDVLTKDGWKHFTELRIGEEIITTRMDGVMEYQPIQDIIDQPYEGTGYVIKGRNIDVGFTSNHRLLLRSRYGKLEYVTVEELYNNRTKYSHHCIEKLGIWDKDSPEYIIIDGISEEDYYSKNYWNFKQDVRQPLKIETTTFCYFLGLYLAEGHVSHTDDRDYSVNITQNKGSKCDFIRDILNKMPVEFSENCNSEKTIFRANDIRLKRYLKSLGNKYEKYIPNDIKQLSSQDLWCLIYGFAIGDGRWRRDLSSKEIEYQDDPINVFSVSKKLIEDLHECLIKSGRSGNWSVFIAENDYIFADRIIKAENKSPLYQLNISTTTGIWLNKDMVKVFPVEHRGNVYCLTVPNGNFYMKQSGKGFWTGNSLSIDLDRISHSIKEMKRIPNSSQWVGKLQLMNTPMGTIAQALVEAGVKLAISSRGVGSFAEDVDESGAKIVNEDYMLVTFDLVHSPGAPNAFLSIKESKEYILENGMYIPVTRSLPEYDSVKVTELKEYSNELVKYIKSLSSRKKVCEDTIPNRLSKVSDAYWKAKEKSKTNPKYKTIAYKLSQKAAELEKEDEKTYRKK